MSQPIIFTQTLCNKFTRRDKNIAEYIADNTEQVEALSIFHYAAVKCIEQNLGNVELAKFVVESIKTAIVQPGTIVLNFDSDLEEGIYRKKLDDPKSLFTELLLFAGQKTNFRWKSITPFVKDLKDEFDMGYLQISGTVDDNFNTQIILGNSIEIDGVEIGDGDMIIRRPSP